jgi:hypothetical protein
LLLDILNAWQLSGDFGLAGSRVLTRWSIGHQGARVWKRGEDELLIEHDLLQAILDPMGSGINRDRVAQYYSRNDNNITAALSRR